MSHSTRRRHRALGYATMTLTLVPLALAGLPATASGNSAAFGQPGPLAVSRTGQVYVASGRELYRLNGDRPVPVAKAAGTIECVVASDSGAIYLGERDQLQKVSPTGHVSVVTRAHVTGLGRGPQGSTYVVTNAAVSRLVNQQLVPVVRRSQFVGVSHVPTQISALTFANVALDAHGNTYITASGIGFSLFEVTRSGNVRYIGPARAGGSPASMTEGPGGRVYIGVQNSILTADAGHLGGFRSFAAGAVKGLTGALAPRYIAASTAPGSPLYADADGQNGFSNDAAIVRINSDHRVVTLWSHAA